MPRNIKSITICLPLKMAESSDRIREYRERQEGVEDAAAETSAILSQRSAVLDGVKIIAAHAEGMRDVLVEVAVTESRAGIESFVKVIVVMPDNAPMHLTDPVPSTVSYLEAPRIKCP